MPWRDGTGPFGEGPLTGRGFGPCGRGMRRGFGRGLGFGRGFDWRFQNKPVQLTKEEEKKILEAEKADLEEELKAIKEKLQELKK